MVIVLGHNIFRLFSNKYKSKTVTNLKIFFSILAFIVSLGFMINLWVHDSNTIVILPHICDLYIIKSWWILIMEWIAFTATLLTYFILVCGTCFLCCLISDDYCFKEEK